MAGRWCRVEPIDPAGHADELHRAFKEDADGRIWTYLSYGPFDSAASYREWLRSFCSSPDPLFFAIRDTAGSGRAVGVASYTRIKPGAGAIEVAHVCYSPSLQRTTAATEAMYLMMRRAFDLGYRRYEWKCDALNRESERAALRLGFQYEGTFRQAVVYRGRNRDTSWFSVIDREWPELRARFEAWLEPGNFDSAGKQRHALGTITLPPGRR
jgi:RimJ/RimL family protein N-acetyltransferase